MARAKDNNLTLLIFCPFLYHFLPCVLMDLHIARNCEQFLFQCLHCHYLILPEFFGTIVTSMRNRVQVLFVVFTCREWTKKKYTQLEFSKISSHFLGSFGVVVQTYLYFNKVSSCVHIVDIECSEQAILLHNHQSKHSIFCLPLWFWAFHHGLRKTAWAHHCSSLHPYWFPPGLQCFEVQNVQNPV